MSISVYIGRRLSFGSHSAGVPIAVGGIALALIIMMLSIAVVTGFKKEIRRKVAGFNSEITIYPQSRTLAEVTAMTLDDTVLGTIKSVAPDARASGVVELPGILKTPDAFQGVMVKALEPEADGYRFIRENMSEGTMPADSAGATQPSVTISATVARKLGLAPGDKVDMHFVTRGSLRTRRATVSGIYDTHFNEYDSRFIYVTPEAARSIGRLGPDDVTSVEVNGIGTENIPDVSGLLSTALLTLSAGSTSNPAGQTFYYVDNVLLKGQAYFSWLDLLDTNVVVILILMSLVSGFTLISSLFILILERVRTIGILKSLGATNAQIRGIFIYMAERLVARGLIIGNAVCIPLILAQERWHIVPLDAESYFLNHVPVDVSWTAILTLNVAVVVISALILIGPSHLIATLSPSESMRYE